MRKITPLLLSGLIALSALTTVDSAEAKRRGRSKKDLVVRGIISALTPEAVVVDGNTILLKPKTKYEDFSGHRVTLSAFVVGDCVKVKLVRAQTAATAREMELEDSCPSGRGDDDLSTPIPSATATSTPVGTGTPSGTPSASATPDDSSTPGATPTSTATPSITVTPVATPTCSTTPHFEDRDSEDDDRNDDKDRSGKRNRRGRGKVRGHSEDNHRHVEDHHRRR